MITLFGATGFTGRLIAAALDQQQLSFRIAGRSEEKLCQLSAALQSKPAWIIADVGQPSTLPALFSGSDVLINCAGPYTDMGEKVIIQAAMSGVAYLDLTNELGFFFRMRSYHEMAQRNGATLVPGCGFEIALADCAAEVLAQKIGQGTLHKHFDAVDILYRLEGNSASSGTRKSAIRSLATSWIMYRDGEWSGKMPGSEVRTFVLPGGSQTAFIFPSCESVTIPIHLKTENVNVWMAANPSAQFWAPFLIPMLARASRSILRGPILAVAASGGRKVFSPNLAAGRDSPFEIIVRLHQANKIHSITLSGQNPYQQTANIIAYAARQLMDPNARKKGFLAPAQALNPANFLKTAQELWDITMHESSENSD